MYRTLLIVDGDSNVATSLADIMREMLGESYLVEACSDPESMLDVISSHDNIFAIVSGEVSSSGIVADQICERLETMQIDYIRLTAHNPRKFRKYRGKGVILKRGRIEDLISRIMTYLNN